MKYQIFTNNTPPDILKKLKTKPLSKENAMTTAHVEKFAEMMVNDPALNARVIKHKKDMSVFASIAVQEGNALGLFFTAQEFTTFVMAERSTAEAGELSDLELDAVAGGAPRFGIGKMKDSHNKQTGTGETTAQAIAGTAANAATGSI